VVRLAEFVDRLEREASDAERYEATARVDVVLRSVIEDLRDVEADAAGATEAEPDQLIDVNEAAGVLGVKVRYLYEHHDQFPFTRRIGRQLRFSKRGITRYLARRR
jgi:predicted DNA-binding transcriptional regulator AlpA